MKAATILLRLSLLGASVTGTPLATRAAAGIPGFDISHYQAQFDFPGASKAGAKFGIMKATEGTTYIDASFRDHFDAAAQAGLVRGAYHFAHPDASAGAAQARHFLQHGGTWTPDGRTLPGMLDVEYNPHKGGDACYGLTPAAMTRWIRDWVDTYHTATGRWPLIYTTTNWWTQCTGNAASFGQCPLVLARFASSVGTLPAGWTAHTIWQNSDKYPFGGDADLFNGSADDLKKLAASNPQPTPGPQPGTKPKPAAGPKPQQHPHPKGSVGIRHRDEADHAVRWV